MKIDDFKEEGILMKTPTAKDENYNVAPDRSGFQRNLIISTVSEQENDESPGMIEEA